MSSESLERRKLKKAHRFERKRQHRKREPTGGHQHCMLLRRKNNSNQSRVEEREFSRQKRKLTGLLASVVSGLELGVGADAVESSDTG